MNAYMKEIAELRERVDELEEELRQLKDSLAPPDNPFIGKFGLTKQLAAVLFCLYRTEIATTEHLDAVTARYGQVYAGRKGDDWAITVRTKVAVTKLRKKLKPYGVEFETVWGVGYSMGPEDKVKLAKMLEEAK
jgi:hypothetical protein